MKNQLFALHRSFGDHYSDGHRAGLHGHISPYDATWPTFGDRVFVAPTASVIGRVDIGANTSIWYTSVVRGDENTITIGADTNIQDGTIIHIDHRTFATVIGDRVTIGHGAIIHACTLKSDCFVGMGATVLDGSTIESDAMLAAGALLSPGKTIPSGELWAGVPAKKMRILSQAEITDFRRSAKHYCALAVRHMKNLENQLNGSRSSSS